MNPEAQKKIEAYLKKAGFSKITGKDVWMMGLTPHMRIVDLGLTPPWAGITTGTQRIEAEDCGIAQVRDIKQEVLSLYGKEVKKPADQEIGTLPLGTPSPEVEPPLKPESAAIAPPGTAGESYQYFCSACQAGISAEQRSTSVKEHGRALCEKCVTITPESSKEQAVSKEYTLRYPPGDTVPKPVDREKLKEAFKKIEEKTQSQPKPVEVPKRSLAGELEPTKDYKGDVGWEKPPTKPIHKPDAMIPARMAIPQGNYIKGLVPMMKEIGKIKIGTKGEAKQSQKGTSYRPPVKFDHFEIVSVLRDDKGNLIPDPVMQELGENPKELDIFLLYNDETLNFTTRYNEYKGGKCQCSGDGVKARLINGDEIECNPEICKVFKEKRCKPNGILSVILTKSPRLGGVYKFRTTSYNSIRSILSSLFFIKSLTGGVLAMIPLKLTVSPMTVQPKDSMTPQTIYVVNIEFAGTVQQLLEKTVEVSKYQSMMRANIKQLEATARASLAIPESEEEGKDIQAEFYPEKPEEAKQ